MTDLQELRDALCARESMAPEPGDVLAGAGRRIRRRRIASVAVAVFVTTAGVSAGVAATHPRPSAPDLPVAAATATTLSAPSLPFSFASGSYRIASWATGKHETKAQYVTPSGRAVDIAVLDHDPGRPTATSLTTAQLHGKTITMSDRGSTGQEMYWQEAPGRWFTMEATMASPPQLLALAAAVKTGESTPSTSPLRSLRVPQGYELDSWLGDPVGDTVVLCPGGRSGDDHCVTVSVSRAGLTTQNPPSAVTSRDVALPATAPRTTTAPVLRETLVRQLDSGHWISVEVADGDQALAAQLADSAVTD
jgi:hypothetical protein